MKKQITPERQQLIIQYLPQVKRIVNRTAIHLPPGIESDDLISAGIIGLIGAVDRYDPDRAKHFKAYASICIKGAILSELRSRDFLSRKDRKQIRDMEKTILELEKKLGRPVQDQETMVALGIDMDQFDRLKRMAGITFLSFEDLGCYSDGERQNLISYMINKNYDEAFELTYLKEINTVLSKIINKLAQKEKLVVSLYYWEELTMKEVGKVMDISESRVSQLHSHAMGVLKKELTKAGLINL